MSRAEIKDAIRAYLLCTRELNVDFMPINPDAINYALRLIGKTMANKSIIKWIRKYFKDKQKHAAKEESEDTGYKQIDKIVVCKNKKGQKYLEPQEFIFLVAHAENRIERLKDFPGCLHMLKTGR